SRRDGARAARPVRRPRAAARSLRRARGVPRPVPARSADRVGMTLEPEPQRHIGHLIRRAQQVHATMWAEEVSTVVTSVQYGVLTVLERMPGASQKEIGLEASLDKSTVAELLHRMERGGL